MDSDQLSGICGMEAEEYSSTYQGGWCRLGKRIIRMIGVMVRHGDLAMVGDQILTESGMADESPSIIEVIWLEEPLAPVVICSIARWEMQFIYRTLLHGILTYRHKNPSLTGGMALADSS